MKRFHTLNVLLLLCGALVLSACSPTVLTGSWRDPEYKGGPPKKVLIVGMAQKELGRRIFEDEFVRQLQEAGVQAAPSYPIFTPAQLKEDREQIEARVRELGFDQVIVTRIVDRRIEQVTTPGTAYGTGYYGGGWNNYYRDSYTVVYQPPTTYQIEVATLESKLFALGSNKLIWSGQLETETSGTALSDSLETVIRSFVEVVVKDLKKERLL